MATHNLKPFGDGISISIDGGDETIYLREWITNFGFKENYLQFHVNQPEDKNVFFNINITDLQINGVTPESKELALVALQELFKSAGGTALPTYKVITLQLGGGKDVILENTFTESNDDITISRGDAGQTLITLPLSSLLDKLIIGFAGANYDATHSPIDIIISKLSDEVVLIETYAGAVLSDSILSETPIEIRVYQDNSEE